MINYRTLFLAATTAGSLCLSASAMADRILIDIGGGSRTASGQFDTYLGDTTVGGLYWNTQPNRDGTILPDLIRATDGASTGISMDITADFAGTRTETFGLDAALDSYQYSPGAFTDALFTQNGSAFEIAQLTFAGLDSQTTYDFTFFASRNGVSDFREGQYSVIGGNGATVVTLNASNNNSNVVTASGVTADANGEIVINITASPDSESAYAYLNLIDVQTTAVPEPASLGLLATGALALLRRRSR